MAVRGERWCGRRGAGELSEFSGTGSSPTHGIERSAVGGRVPLLSPNSRARGRPSALGQLATRTRRRRGAVAAVAMAGWFSLSLGAWLPSAAPDFPAAPPELRSFSSFAMAVRGERWCGRRGAGELSEFSGTGSSPTHGIERSAVGGRVPLLSPDSRARGRPSALGQLATRTRLRRGAVAAVAMAGWFSLSLGAWLPSAAPDWGRRRPAPPELRSFSSFAMAVRGERWCGRRGAGELSEFSGTGSSPTHGIERSAVGGRVPLLSPILAREADPARSVSGRPAPAAGAALWLLSPWRDGSLYPLARGCRAPRRITGGAATRAARATFFFVFRDGGSRRTLVWAPRRRRAQRVFRYGVFANAWH